MKRTHCKRGHAMTVENTSREGRCVTCRREVERKRLCDPEQRERKNALRRERYAENREWRERRKVRDRQRYAEDVEFRARKLAAARARVVRIMSDPVLAEQFREARRFYSEGARRRAGIPERQWGLHHNRLPKRLAEPTEILPVAPILGWVDEYVQRSGETITSLCERAGVPPRRITGWRSGEYERVSLSTVDKLLFAAGEHAWLHELYPLKEEYDLAV